MILLYLKGSALDILEETWWMNSKLVDTPRILIPNFYQIRMASNPKQYRRLIGKLNYLIVTRPDIFFAVSTVSQFLNFPCEKHWNAVIRILKYIKGSRKGLLYGSNNHTRVVFY